MARPNWPKDCAAELQAELKRTHTKGQLRLVLCLLLREVTRLKPDQIAQVLGMRPPSVRAVQSSYAREGKAIFLRPGRGGDRRRHLRVPEERALLDDVMIEARPNIIVEFRTIQAAYERKAGYPVAHSVVYRMLRRHGWRKVVLEKIMAPRGWAASKLP